MELLNDILVALVQIMLLIIVGMVAYGSSVLVSEKKERQRKGLTDYYDNPIPKDKCMGGEDEFQTSTKND